MPSSEPWLVQVTVVCGFVGQNGAVSRSGKGVCCFIDQTLGCLTGVLFDI